MQNQNLMSNNQEQCDETINEKILAAAESIKRANRRGISFLDSVCNTLSNLSHMCFLTVTIIFWLLCIFFIAYCVFSLFLAAYNSGKNTNLNVKITLSDLWHGILSFFFQNK